MEVEVPRAPASLEIALLVIPPLAATVAPSAAQVTIGTWMAVVETGPLGVRKAGFAEKGPAIWM